MSLSRPIQWYKLPGRSNLAERGTFRKKTIIHCRNKIIRKITGKKSRSTLKLKGPVRTDTGLVSATH